MVMDCDGRSCPISILFNMFPSQSQQAAQGTAQRTASRCVQQALPFFSMLHDQSKDAGWESAPGYFKACKGSTINDAY